MTAQPFEIALSYTFTPTFLSSRWVSCALTFKETLAARSQKERQVHEEAVATAKAERERTAADAASNTGGLLSFWRAMATSPQQSEQPASQFSAAALGLTTPPILAPSPALTAPLDTGLLGWSGTSQSIYEIYTGKNRLPFETVTLREQEVPSGRSFEALIAPSASTTIGQGADPLEMLNEFLRLKHTTSALEAFLYKWGVWSGSTLDRGGLLLGIRGDSDHVTIPSKVWQHQKSFREALLAPATDWLDKMGQPSTGLFAEKPPLSPMRMTPTFPFFSTSDTTCYDAIRSTITLLKLRNQPWRQCKRVACGLPFLPKNQRRIFCNSRCENAERMRLARASGDANAKG